MFDILGMFAGGSISLLGLYASALQIADHRMSKSVAKAKFATLPVSIKKGITYRQLLHSVRMTKDILDEIRFVPDLVIGIHYNGLSFASLIAKELYVPIHHASIHYGTDTGRHVCDSVLFSIDPTELHGQNVLLVDNSIDTGATLEMVRALLEGNGVSVKTLVFYQKAQNLNSPRRPDLVLFASKKPLECFVR